MHKLICAHCRRSFEAVRYDAITCSQVCRKARERRLRTITPPLPALPEGSVELLLIDLPLAWHGFSPKGEGRSPQHHYDTMDIPALCRLGERFEPLIAKHAVAAAWVYGPRQWDLPIVMKAFGFTYSGEGFNEFTWIKIGKAGQPRIVNGKTTRKGMESVTLWKRGKGLRIADHGVPQVIFAPVEGHSRKSQQIHKGLELLYGPVRRLELFARKTRPGWTVWGNQVDKQTVPSSAAAPDQASAAHQPGALMPSSPLRSNSS